MTDNILLLLKTNASSIIEKDLDWIVPKLIDFYNQKLDSLAYEAYGKENNFLPEVANLAFKERAKIELRSALNTFLFKKKHWEKGREINPYLITSIKRLANKIKKDQMAIKSHFDFACPACKENGRRESLVKENNLLRCNNCTDNLFRLQDEKKKITSDSDKSRIQLECNFYEIFSLHSKKGYKCPDCLRFIPHIDDNKIICPYLDCIFIGRREDVNVMNHPTLTAYQVNLSIESMMSTPKKTYLSNKFVGIFKSNIINSDVIIDVKENILNEYNLLLKIIDEQIDLVKRTNSSGTIVQKTLMYKAYRSMVNKFPEEMISYLVHKKRQSDFPVQARIFQEYTRLIEEYLPFTIKKGNNKYEIVDLTDPNLSLFVGVSEFEATVNSKNIIPNKTKETYTGGRMFKNYGPCFIGKVIDIIELETGNSIKDKMLDHSFLKIKMDKSIKCGTKVKVKHFRILPHYEIQSLMWLRRVRKKIVKSLSIRLNNQENNE